MKRFSVMAVMILVMALLTTGTGEQEETDDMNRQFTNETLQDCNPYTFNKEKAEALGLADQGKFTDEYFLLQSFYCEGLWNWLCIEADLDAVDRGIGENDLRFVERTQYVTVYQEKQSFGTRFIYIRSNIMIENLNRGDIDTLRELWRKGDATSDEMMRYVGETWLKVITQNIDEPGEIMCIHDLSTGRRVANCSLILGIDTMMEVDSDGRMLDVEHEREKDAFLARLAGALGDELSDIFGIPVVVIIHG